MIKFKTFQTLSNFIIFMRDDGMGEDRDLIEFESCGEGRFG